MSDQEQVSKQDPIKPSEETSPSPASDSAALRKRATRTGLTLLAGAIAVLVLAWVAFPLIRGGSSQSIQAAESAIQDLYLSPQRDFLAQDISTSKLEAAKSKVQALGGWSGYRLMQDYQAAEARYQAIQALSQLYASDQALIQGSQVNHQAKLAEGVTAETVKTVAGNESVTKVGKQDALGQAIQELIAEADQVFSLKDKVTAAISDLSLGTTVDQATVDTNVATLQAIEQDIQKIEAHTDAQDLSDQLKDKAKDFAKAVAKNATDDNLSKESIEALWSCASLADGLSGSVIDHRKLISLTFDDGPNPEVTEKLLAVLDKHQVKATFFMMGGFVEKYPEIARKVRDAGHQIGNHTYTHPDMAKESDEGVKKQIQYAQEAIQEATGVTPTLYRLPFGSGGKRVVDLLQPMTSIVWNVDSEDWKSHDKDMIIEQVLSHLQPKSVILMHDTHISTVEAIDVLIPIFKEKGYHFVMPQQNDLGYYYY